jgi:phosphoenolpyruvate-protein phosphotransferase
VSQTVRSQKLAGQGISPGLAVGSAYVYEGILQHTLQYYAIEEWEVEGECTRIEQAISEVREQLEDAETRVREQCGEALAAVFEAHRAMLDDSSLREELRGELKNELVNAEEVVKRVFRRWQRRLRRGGSGLPTSPDQDVADLGRSLLRRLAGVRAHLLEALPEGSVLVAPHLLPSDTVHLTRGSVVAIVVGHAGPGSHAALLTRELGVPAVAQIPNLLDQIAPHETLLVDGFSGSVVVAPEEATEAAFEKRIGEHRECLKRARRRCREPAQTRDGARVVVMANIGCREDADRAAELGADGIGLYRLESLFLSSRSLPSEAELFGRIRETLQPMAGSPITLRLLDVGGDKAVPWLDLPHESNPFLGRRGIRLLLDFPELLSVQLRTFLQLSQELDVRILVPMVTLAEEMEKVRDLAFDLGAERGFETIPPIGAMIETPAAALCTDTIARSADFLGIGTNDLTQYTMVAGRENPLVAHYFQERHTAVMRLLRMIGEAADDTPLAVCGELAADPEGVSTLLELGIRSLSVAPPRVPYVKEAVRTARLDGAKVD